MSGLTVIRVRHRCCLKFACLIRFGQYWCLVQKQLVLRVSTLVPVGSKLPNRVRWPGGGIPYTFQNIPLCPGVVWQNTREPESPDYPIPWFSDELMIFLTIPWFSDELSTKKKGKERWKTSGIAITIIYLFDGIKGEKSMQSMIIIIYYNNLCKMHTFFTPCTTIFHTPVQETTTKYFLFLHSNPPEKLPPMLLTKRSQTHIRTNQTHRAFYYKYYII